MAIELKQSLKLSQQLVITPQLQQAIKLLQLSRLELREMIENELLENPLLEEGPQPEDEEVPAEVAKELEAEEIPDKTHPEHLEMSSGSDGQMTEPKEFDWENYLGTYNDAGQEARTSFPEEGPNYENMVTKPTTLEDHLVWQLRMTDLSEREEAIGVVLIGALDDKGYLTISVEEIAAKNGYDLDEVQDILLLIQEFDPIGVGARDLKECLLLQAKKMGLERPLLEAIINEHLHLLERRDYPTLARKLKVPLKRILTAAKLISEMEPKPGRPFGRQDTQYITPDVYVIKIGNEYTITLNEEGLPKLRVSSFYRSMLSRGNGSTGDVAKGFIQEKLKGAMWLIKSIHQRQRTLYRVSKAIVKFQTEFFDKGVNYLKPMILKDVAEEIGVHESTVSRATSNKFMHTPQGIFELKYFFNSGVAAHQGQDVASESVKEMIRGIVAREDNKKPFSDKDIVSMLKEGNIDIARRTVAKYREMLGILPSSKRRQLY